MTTLVVNSQDLGQAGSIDTYQTYNAGDFEYNMVQYYNEQNGTNLEYDDFEWDYDMDTVVSELAEKRAELLESDNEAISKVVTLATYSPKEYNYQTDSADYEITYDESVVDNYIKEHAEDFRNWYHESGWASTIDWRDEGDKKEKLHKVANLAYYLNKVIDDPVMELMEYEYDIYENNTTMTLVKEDK